MKSTIMVTENVFSKEECESIINAAPIAIEKYKHNNVKDNAGQSLIQTASDVGRQDLQLHGPMVLSVVNEMENKQFARLSETLNSALDVYADEFPIIRKFHIEQCQISYHAFKVQRTKIGEGFHNWHFEATAESLRSRFLTWTLFLNDVDEGGETEFIYKNVRIPPKQGSLCLFPADWTHTHRGNSPISNEKWIMTGWYEYFYPGL